MNKEQRRRIEQFDQEWRCSNRVMHVTVLPDVPEKPGRNDSMPRLLKRKIRVNPYTALMVAVVLLVLTVVGFVITIFISL